MMSNWELGPLSSESLPTRGDLADRLGEALQRVGYLEAELEKWQEAFRDLVHQRDRLERERDDLRSVINRARYYGQPPADPECKTCGGEGVIVLDSVTGLPMKCRCILPGTLAANRRAIDGKRDQTLMAFRKRLEELERERKL